MCISPASNIIVSVESESCFIGRGQMEIWIDRALKKKKLKQQFDTSKKAEKNT
jgi:hypothetical protein